MDATDASVPPSGSMTAAFVEAFGPADAIRVASQPIPSPGPTDVLVRVDLVAANPVDTLIRAGRFRTPVPWPFIVGRDLVGTVAWAPPDRGVRPGDAVWCNSLGYDGRQGSFAEYAVVPVERCYPVPAGVDPAVVVAAAHPAATAWLGLFAHARVQPGEVVYVGGAAGNVGAAAASMAHRAGARVVAGVRPPDIERARAAGADAVVDYRDPDLARTIREAAPDGIDVFWDTSGHHDFVLVAAVVAPKARVLLSAAPPGGSAPPLPVRALYTLDIDLAGFVISRATADELRRAATLIGDMLRRSELTPRVVDVLPLTSTTEVHRRLEAGLVRGGRILLRP